jgi:hypothetical protein
VSAEYDDEKDCVDCQATLMALDDTCERTGPPLCHECEKKRLEEERDDAKRGWDGAIAAKHGLVRQIAELHARVAELERLHAERDALDGILTRSAADEIRGLREALVEIVRIAEPPIRDIAAMALARVFP